MSRIKDIHSFTVPAEDGNLYDIYYTEIIGGISGCTMLVNNVLVNVAPQSSFLLRVNTISATTGCYLGGERTWFESEKSFISTWSTTNISSGSSTATQIKLPLVSAGTYNFIVEWGDGSSSKITSWNQAETTHTYVLGGTYQMKITGICQGWTFANTGDRLKLLEITQWGTLRPGDNTAVFMGCGNLKLDNVKGILDTTGMTSFYYLFQNCTSLVKVNRINEWNTSGITYMGQAFDSCINFNDNIGNWDTSNVTTFDRMFCHAGKFNNGDSPDINKWNTANVTFMRFMFGADGTVPGGTYMSFNQPIGNWNTSKVTNMSSMFGRNTEFNQNINTQEVTRNNVTYLAWDTLNVTDMSFMFWILGALGKFNQNIGNWNTSKVTLMNSMFSGQQYFNQNIGTRAVSVDGVTYTAWDTLNVTNMSFMFNVSSSLGAGVFNNSDANSFRNWNTSKVTLMNSMFSGQQYFNQNIGTRAVSVDGVTYTAWDTLNVTNMSFMFNAFSSMNTNSGIFNNAESSTISNWNTSKVTNMSSMFQNQVMFNQNLNTMITTINSVTYTAWDTLNVTNMSNLFGVYRALGNFNQSLGNWNTAKVTLMNSMFNGQVLFDKNIGTRQVTVGGSTYNAWDTLNVTNMTFMFSATLLASSSEGVFNNGGTNAISNWNTSKVTTFQGMFQNQPLFNQNLRTNPVTVGGSAYTSWNTLEVTSMRYMFFNKIGNATHQFNQPIGNWNTAKVTDMTAMLYNTVNFNQNISSWNVSLVTVFNSPTELNETFADGIGLSTTNYDALLIGWASRPVLANKAISFGTTKYSTAAVAAKAILTSAPNNWTIIDGGLI